MESGPKEKLFTFKDVDGKEQFETIELAGRLLDFLRKKDERIKSISIVGSTVKGHAINNGRKKSDLDICLIYNDEHSNSKSESDVSYNAEYKYFPEFASESNVEIHPLSEVNVATLDKVSVLSNPCMKIEGLIFPMLGDVTANDAILQRVRDIVMNLTPEEKNVWVDKFVNDVMRHEHSRKYLIRTGQDIYDSGIRLEYLEKIKRLYRQRISKLFIDEK